MDPRRAQLVLEVWERANASLRECVAALSASDWDASLACAALDGGDAGIEIGRRAHFTADPVDGQVDPHVSPTQKLAKLKGLLREHHDVSEGTLPRSLVWVSEGAMRSTPIVAHWERHRYFLGAPMVRWFPERRGDHGGARSVGGYLRIERNKAQAASRSSSEEALLIQKDVRWVIDRLASFSARSGIRFGVELCGATGWVGAKGCDSALEAACDRLLEVDGQRVSEMRSAFACLDFRDTWDLLDALPDRRRGVVDCGWAAHHETSLLRAAHVLRHVDLVADAAQPENQALEALRVAAESSNVRELLLAREIHRTPTAGSFTEILDRVLLEHGSRVIGDGWREVSRDEACLTWRTALTTSLAYGSPLMSKAEATNAVERFASLFDADALFFRNGDDSSYSPVLGTTLERGAAVVDANAAGVLFVGDED